MLKTQSLGVLAATLAVCSWSAAAQSGARTALTAADYARAEKFMGYNANPLVLGAGLRPTWLSGGRFWYRVTTARGEEFLLVDAAHGARRPAFDQARLAAALSTAMGRTIEPYHLPFGEFELSNGGQAITVRADSRTWTCDLDAYRCQQAEAARTRPSGTRGSSESVSPDGKRAVFIRDYNLWMRDVSTARETQLTTDGMKDFGYATDNAGWTTSDHPIVLWSPDSKKIATYQQDQRGVGEMYLVDTRIGHPELRAWKYPLPGDAVVTTIQRVIVEIDPVRVVRLRMPADQHRSSLCDDISCGGSTLTDAEWSPDGTHLAFVSTSRDHKHEIFRIADAATGAVRDVFDERVATFFESGVSRPNWRYLPGTNEAIWFSERDGWGHLYLYDLAEGRPKSQITSGAWNVTEVLRVDDRTRQIFFLGVGREKGRDPYFAQLYRVGIDGRNLKLLTPEDGNHDVSLSPGGEFFVDSYSKPDAPSATVLRDAEGKQIAVLERADISRLQAAGWKPPVPFTVKARDGVTDLYGLLYRPTNFDPNLKYPVVNHIYPGPQTGSVGSRNFLAARGDAQALAELGFVVVEIDGMGTPWRSKRFHEAYYGDMGDNTLPDQVAGMKQLAQRYPWIDLDRAGIYGHSGGGFAAAAAMFRYPDFFKVGISEAGNHDNRNYEDDWAEKWQGLLESRQDGTSNYDGQANQNLVANLKGRLLLAHGTMDNNVPPYNTLLVVDALIRANKDFDLLMLPNRNHGFGADPYMVRRRWDYFVRYLLGAEPPAGYELHAAPPRTRSSN